MLSRQDGAAYKRVDGNKWIGTNKKVSGRSERGDSDKDQLGSESFLKKSGVGWAFFFILIPSPLNYPFSSSVMLTGKDYMSALVFPT